MLTAPSWLARALGPLVVSVLVVGALASTAVAARPDAGVDPTLAPPVATSALVLPFTADPAPPVTTPATTTPATTTPATTAPVVTTAAPARRVTAPRPTASRPPARKAAPRESAQAHADRLGKAALASLRFPTERLGYRIVFRPYTGGTLGLADSPSRTITLFVKRSQDRQQLRVTLAHEIGHVVDYLTSSDASRADYRSARGMSQQGTWFPCNGCSDFASPAGDFAEVFALWLAGPGDFRSRMAPAPSDSALADLGRLFFQPPA